MDALGIETMSLKPVDAAQKERAKAAKVANQFEAVFVKTLVQSLRSTASVGGEGGMFGEGPGADTYAGWFDQNVAEELAGSGGIGIASALMEDMERHGAIDEHIEKVAEATRAADRSSLNAAKTKNMGGSNGLL